MRNDTNDHTRLYRLADGKVESIAFRVTQAARLKPGARLTGVLVYVACSNVCVNLAFTIMTFGTLVA